MSNATLDIPKEQAERINDLATRASMPVSAVVTTTQPEAIA
jgi:hypothetical protein